MSLFADVLKKMTSAAAELGEVVVNGLSDLTESVVGENAITRAARNAGHTVVRGMKEVADATIEVGEAIVQTICGTGEGKKEGGKQDRGPLAPDFVEPAGSE